MSTIITGVGKDAAIETNSIGGKQSYSLYAFHMLPIRALFAAATVAKEGAVKYDETRLDRNYTKISCDSHLNHALQHIFAHLAGDTSDSHLSHALTRLMFAYECALLEEEVCDEQN